MSVYISNTAVGTTPVLVPGPTDVPKEITASRDIWLGDSSISVGSGTLIGAGRIYSLSPGTWYVVCNTNTELDVRIPNQKNAEYAPGDEYGVSLASGCLNVDSRGAGTALVWVSGLFTVSCFRAPKSFIAKNLSAVTSSTAAGATPTLCKMGLYRANSDDSLTLLSGTPNDTSLFNTTATRFVKALSSSVFIEKGERYGAGLIIVSGAAMPNIVVRPGVTGMNVLSAISPRIGANVSGQADLPESVGAGSGGTNLPPIMEILP